MGGKNWKNTNAVSRAVIGHKPTASSRKLLKKQTKAKSVVAVKSKKKATRILTNTTKNKPTLSTTMKAVQTKNATHKKGLEGYVDKESDTSREQFESEVNNLGAPAVKTAERNTEPTAGGKRKVPLATDPTVGGKRKAPLATDPTAGGKRKASVASVEGDPTLGGKRGHDDTTKEVSTNEIDKIIADRLIATNETINKAAKSEKKASLKVRKTHHKNTTVPKVEIVSGTSKNSSEAVVAHSKHSSAASTAQALKSL